MATEKVGVYRKYHGPVPRDSSGRPLPQERWAGKRPFRWAVRWFGSDGRRYSKSFPTRREAERFAETQQSEVREGRADKPRKITLREYGKEHGQLMKGSLAPKTLHMQLATLRLLAEAVGWDRDLGRISSRDIERFRSERLATGISPSSANREVKTLKRLFNLAILRRYIPSGGNPCDRIPLIRIGRERPPYCGPGEFEAIYARASDSLWRALLVLLYTTGLRLREALNLTWADVDFAAGQVHVTRKAANGYVQSWTPKDHEMRSVPPAKLAVDLLAAWQSVAPEGCPYAFMEPGRWVYYRQRVDDGQWISGTDLVNNLLRRFKTLCKRAGVGPFTIHDLRRSCITNWAQRLPIHVVQQFAGHSDIKTTQRFYLSVQPEDLAGAQQVGEAVVAHLPAADATDPRLTHSARKRDFPGRKVFAPDAEDQQLREVMKRSRQGSNL